MTARMNKAFIIQLALFGAFVGAPDVSRAAPPDKIEAMAEEMPFAQAALADETMSELDRNLTRVFYKSELVAERITAELSRRPAMPWEGYYIAYSFLRAEELTIGGGRYAIIGQVRDTGSYEKRGDTLLLSSEKMESDGECARPSKQVRELRIIPWDQRVYLIDTDRLINFCNAVNAGFEPRKSPDGEFFVKEEGWKLPARGLPTVPRSVSGYLLDSEIRANVRLAGKTETVDSLPGRPVALTGPAASINKGRKEGLAAGMEMFVVGDQAIVIARIVQCDENRSKVLLEVVGPDSLTDSEIEKLTFWTRWSYTSAPLAASASASPASSTLTGTSSNCNANSSEPRWDCGGHCRGKHRRRRCR